MTLSFEPKFEFLLACCGSGRNLHEFTGLLGALDGETMFELATRHRVLPSVCSALQNWKDSPEELRFAAGSRIREHARRVLRFAAELARIAAQFDANRIHFLAHKGPALAQLLYGDPAKRQFGDLDLLVRAQDVQRARQALVELGYEPRLRLSPRQERAYLRSGYEYAFGLNAERNLVELQWQILPRFYSIDFDVDALFERSVEIELDGFRLRTLGREDLMLVVCVHAAKHEWAQLGMLRDIAVLARCELDWDWIHAEARRLGISRILQASLQAARNLFGGQLPPQMTTSDHASVLAENIVGVLRRGVEPDTESLRYFQAAIRMRERKRDRVRFAWRLATTPSVGEWERVNIPDAFLSLYRGVRIARLLRRLA